MQTNIIKLTKRVCILFYFIDDFSRKTWIYFMKNKDEFFSKFKEFKALIENHTENNIKTFQSDNGGEFTSNEFTSNEFRD